VGGDFTIRTKGATRQKAFATWGARSVRKANVTACKLLTLESQQQIAGVHLGSGLDQDFRYWPMFGFGDSTSTNWL
jgi:hypothetical protein